MIPPISEFFSIPKPNANKNNNGDVNYQKKRPDDIKITSDQLELEEMFNNLTNDEIHNRVKAHLGDVWARPPEKPKNRHIENMLDKYVENKFKKHVLMQKEFEWIRTVEDFKNFAYKIIKEPDKIYCEIAKDGNLYVAFFKDDVMVITSDDNMSISSMYKIKDSSWLKTEKKAVIKIY